MQDNTPKDSIPILEDVSNLTLWELHYGGTEIHGLICRNDKVYAIVGFVEHEYYLPPL